MPRHKCFVSYHRDDEDTVLAFKDRFDEKQDCLIFRGQSMPEDIINSTNDEYVIGQIRERFLKDSSVTVVMVGACTWSRRFVDWEVQASLRQPADGKPNGLLAILLDPTTNQGRLPDRVKLNVASGYARFMSYPSTAAELSSWIEDAYEARTDRPALIQNPRERKSANDYCL